VGNVNIFLTTGVVAPSGVADSHEGALMKIRTSVKAGAIIWGTVTGFCATVTGS